MQFKISCSHKHHYNYVYTLITIQHEGCAANTTTFLNFGQPCPSQNPGCATGNHQRSYTVVCMSMALGSWLQAAGNRSYKIKVD